MATPAITAAIVNHCSMLGRAPCATAKIMESAGYDAAIGATRDIGPSANAAKSESVERAKKMPLAAGSQSCGQKKLTASPLMRSQPEIKTRPEKVTTRTVGMGPTTRAGKRARKSFTPQERAATSPSRTE